MTNMGLPCKNFIDEYKYLLTLLKKKKKDREVFPLKLKQISISQNIIFNR